MNTVFMAKMNRDFALAREIIDDNENAYFSEIFHLIINDFQQS